VKTNKKKKSKKERSFSMYSCHQCGHCFGDRCFYPLSDYYDETNILFKHACSCFISNTFPFQGLI